MAFSIVESVIESTCLNLTRIRSSDVDRHWIPDNQNTYVLLLIKNSTSTFIARPDDTIRIIRYRGNTHWLQLAGVRFLT